MRQIKSKQALKASGLKSKISGKMLYVTVRMMMRMMMMMTTMMMTIMVMMTMKMIERESMRKRKTK